MQKASRPSATILENSLQRFLYILELFSYILFLNFPKVTAVSNIAKRFEQFEEELIVKIESRSKVFSGIAAFLCSEQLLLCFRVRNCVTLSISLGEDVPFNQHSLVTVQRERHRGNGA